MYFSRVCVQRYSAQKSEHTKTNVRYTIGWDDNRALGFGYGKPDARTHGHKCNFIIVF